MSDKIKVLIVDDETLARRGIARILANEEDFSIVAEAANGIEAISAIEKFQPDLIFLDIEMPILDGLGLTEKFDVKNLPEIIFVTAFDEHAIRAFELGAIDYVLKPINSVRFQQTLERVRKRIKSNEQNYLETKFADLVKNLKKPEEKYLTRLAVKENERIRFINTEKIERIVSQGNYIEIFAQNEKFLLRETMDGIESKLNPKDFVRIRRSIIVRISHIKEFHVLFNGEFTVVLLDGKELISSRRYRKNLDILLKN